MQWYLSVCACVYVCEHACSDTWVCAHVYMCVSMHAVIPECVCMCICVWACMQWYLSVCACVYVCEHACSDTSVCVHVYMCVSMHAVIPECVCLCICVWACMQWSLSVCACVYVCEHACSDTWVCVHVYMCVSMHAVIPECVCMCICVWACMQWYLSVCACVYVCEHACSDTSVFYFRFKSFCLCRHLVFGSCRQGVSFFINISSDSIFPPHNLFYCYRESAYLLGFFNQSQRLAGSWEVWWFGSFTFIYTETITIPRLSLCHICCSLKTARDPFLCF